MTYLKQHAPGAEDAGAEDAGDASASLYRINVESIDPTPAQRRTGLTEGEDIESRRAAAHGQPDASLDGDAQDAAGEDSGRREEVDETSI